MKRKIFTGLFALVLLVCLMGCATLQEKWDKATDDEKARIIIQQTQKTLKVNAELTAAVVEKNPQYKERWQKQVLPMFETANNILGDMIRKGKAGQKVTYTDVIAAIGGRVTEIMDIIRGWGVKVVEIEPILEMLSALEERRLAWITYSGEQLQ